MSLGWPNPQNSRTNWLIFCKLLFALRNISTSMATVKCQMNRRLGHIPNIALTAPFIIILVRVDEQIGALCRVLTEYP